jgi:hypothetical protein
VWGVVPVARQRAALRFLAAQVFDTPNWLLPPAILSRIGPTGPTAGLAARQATVVAALTDPRRLDRMALSARLQPGVGYDAGAYLSELTGAVVGGATPDANRRTLHRVYLERLDALLEPPAATGGPGGGGGGQPQVNVRRADFAALARAELRAVRAAANTHAAASTNATVRAHWADLAARVDAILDPSR